MRQGDFLSLVEQSSCTIAGIAGILDKFMGFVRIKRYGRRKRRNQRSWGGGCLALLMFLAIMMCTWLYVFGMLTPVVLQIAGAERLGKTNSVFENISPVPTVAIHNQEPVPSQIIMEMGDLGQDTLTIGADTTTVIGDTDTGSHVAVVSFTEPGLMDLCGRRSVICRQGNNLYRDVSVDLRAGGAVVYADVNTGLYWQRIGIVTQLNDTRTRFFVSGVDVNGVMYDPATLPFEFGELIEDAIRKIEREGNEALQDLIVTVGGEQYVLAEIAVDDAILALTFR